MIHPLHLRIISALPPIHGTMYGWAESNRRIAWTVGPIRTADTCANLLACVLTQSAPVMISGSPEPSQHHSPIPVRGYPEWPLCIP